MSEKNRKLAQRTQPNRKIKMNCPLTGQPCDHPKFFRANEIADGKTQTFNLCENCMQNYMNTEATRDEIFAHRKAKEKVKRPADMLKDLILGCMGASTAKVDSSDKITTLNKLNEEYEKVKTQIINAVSKEEFETASKLKKELQSIVEKKQEIEKSL